MRTLALAVAFTPILLATPTPVAAEGNCPSNWEMWFVDPAFPADLNDNGIVCAKFHYGNPDDLNDNWVYVRDDR
jgi:hypothetical protein